MEKFTWYRLDDWSNIFFIIPKDNEDFPLIVLGILQVSGKIYKNSFCAMNSISDELFMSDEIERLEDEVQREYFNIVD